MARLLQTSYMSVTIMLQKNRGVKKTDCPWITSLHYFCVIKNNYYFCGYKKL